MPSGTTEPKTELSAVHLGSVDPIVADSFQSKAFKFKVQLFEDRQRPRYKGQL